MKRKNKKLLVGLSSVLAASAIATVTYLGIDFNKKMNSIDNFNNGISANEQVSDYNTITRDLFINTQGIDIHLGDTLRGPCATPFGWLGTYPTVSQDFNGRDPFDNSTLVLTDFNGVVLWAVKDKNPSQGRPIYDAKYLKLNLNNPWGLQEVNGLQPAIILVTRVPHGVNPNEAVGNEDGMVVTIHNAYNGEEIDEFKLDTEATNGGLKSNINVNQIIGTIPHSYYLDYIYLPNGTIVYQYQYDISRFNCDILPTFKQYVDNINSYTQIYETKKINSTVATKRKIIENQTYNNFLNGWGFDLGGNNIFPNNINVGFNYWNEQFQIAAPILFEAANNTYGLYTPLYYNNRYHSNSNNIYDKLSGGFTNLIFNYDEAQKQFKVKNLFNSPLNPSRSATLNLFAVPSFYPYLTLDQVNKNIFVNRKFGKNIQYAITKPVRNIFDSNLITIPYVYLAPKSNDSHVSNPEWNLPIFNASQIYLSKSLNLDSFTPQQVSGYVTFDSPEFKSLFPSVYIPGTAVDLNTKYSMNYDLGWESISNFTNINQINITPWPTTGRETLNAFNRVSNVSPFDNTVIYSTKPVSNYLGSPTPGKSIIDGWDEYKDDYISFYLVGGNPNFLKFYNNKQYIPMMFSNNSNYITFSNGGSVPQLPSQLCYVKPSAQGLPSLMQIKFLDSILFNAISLQNFANSTANFTLLLEQTGSNAGKETSYTLNGTTGAPDPEGPVKTSAIGEIWNFANLASDYIRTITTLSQINNSIYENRTGSESQYNNLKVVSYNYDEYRKNVFNTGSYEYDLSNNYSFISSSANLLKWYPRTFYGKQQGMATLPIGTIYQPSTTNADRLKAWTIVRKFGFQGTEIKEGDPFTDPMIAVRALDLITNYIPDYSMIFSAPTISVTRNDLNLDTLTGGITFNIKSTIRDAVNTDWFNQGQVYYFSQPEILYSQNIEYNIESPQNSPTNPIISSIAKSFGKGFNYAINSFGLVDLNSQFNPLFNSQINKYSTRNKFDENLNALKADLASKGYKKILSIGYDGSGVINTGAYQTDKYHLIRPTFSIVKNGRAERFFQNDNDLYTVTINGKEINKFPLLSDLTINESYQMSFEYVLSQYMTQKANQFKTYDFDYISALLDNHLDLSLNDLTIVVQLTPIPTQTFSNNEFELRIETSKIQGDTTPGTLSSVISYWQIQYTLINKLNHTKKSILYYFSYLYPQTINPDGTRYISDSVYVYKFNPAANESYINSSWDNTPTKNPFVALINPPTDPSFAVYIPFAEGYSPNINSNYIYVNWQELLNDNNNICSPIFSDISNMLNNSISIEQNGSSCYVYLKLPTNPAEWAKILNLLNYGPRVLTLYPKLLFSDTQDGTGKNYTLHFQDSKILDYNNNVLSTYSVFQKNPVLSSQTSDCIDYTNVAKIRFEIPTNGNQNDLDFIQNFDKYRYTKFSFSLTPSSSLTNISKIENIRYNFLNYNPNNYNNFGSFLDYWNGKSGLRSKLVKINKIKINVNSNELSNIKITLPEGLNNNFVFNFLNNPNQAQIVSILDSSFKDFEKKAINNLLSLNNNNRNLVSHIKFKYYFNGQEYINSATSNATTQLANSIYEFATTSGRIMKFSYYSPQQNINSNYHIGFSLFLDNYDNYEIFDMTASQVVETTSKKDLNLNDLKTAIDIKPIIDWITNSNVKFNSLYSQTNNTLTLKLDSIGTSPNDNSVFGNLKFSQIIDKLLEANIFVNVLCKVGPGEGIENWKISTITNSATDFVISNITQAPSEIAINFGPKIIDFNSPQENYLLTNGVYDFNNPTQNIVCSSFTNGSNWFNQDKFIIQTTLLRELNVGNFENDFINQLSFSGNTSHVLINTRNNIDIVEFERQYKQRIIELNSSYNLNIDNIVFEYAFLDDTLGTPSSGSNWLKLNEFIADNTFKFNQMSQIIFGNGIQIKISIVNSSYSFDPIIKTLLPKNNDSVLVYISTKIYEELSNSSSYDIRISPESGTFNIIGNPFSRGQLQVLAKSANGYLSGITFADNQGNSSSPLNGEISPTFAFHGNQLIITLIKSTTPNKIVFGDVHGQYGSDDNKWIIKVPIDIRQNITIPPLSAPNPVEILFNNTQNEISVSGINQETIDAINFQIQQQNSVNIPIRDILDYDVEIKIEGTSGTFHWTDLNSIKIFIESFTKFTNDLSLGILWYEAISIKYIPKLKPDFESSYNLVFQNNSNPILADVITSNQVIDLTPWITYITTNQTNIVRENNNINIIPPTFPQSTTSPAFGQGFLFGSIVDKLLKLQSQLNTPYPYSFQILFALQNPDGTYPQNEEEWVNNLQLLDSIKLQNAKKIGMKIYCIRSNDSERYYPTFKFNGLDIPKEFNDPQSLHELILTSPALINISNIAIQNFISQSISSLSGNTKYLNFNPQQAEENLKAQIIRENDIRNNSLSINISYAFDNPEFKNQDGSLNFFGVNELLAKLKTIQTTFTNVDLKFKIQVIGHAANGDDYILSVDPKQNFKIFELLNQRTQDQTSKIKIYINENFENIANQMIKMNGTNTQIQLEYQSINGKQFGNQNGFLSINGNKIEGLRIQFSEKELLSNISYGQPNNPSDNILSGWVNNQPTSLNNTNRFLIFQLVGDYGYTYSAEYAKEHPEVQIQPENSWSTHNVIPGVFTNQINADYSKLKGLKISGSINIKNNAISNLVLDSNLANILNQVVRPQDVNNVKLEFSLVESNGTIVPSDSGEQWYDFSKLQYIVNSLLNKNKSPFGLIKFLNYQPGMSVSDIRNCNFYINVRLAPVNANDSISDITPSNGSNGLESAKKGVLVNTSEIITLIDFTQVINTLLTKNSIILLNNNQQIQSIQFPNNNSESPIYPEKSINLLFDSLRNVGINVQYSSDDINYTNNFNTITNNNGNLYIRFVGADRETINQLLLYTTNSSGDMIQPDWNGNVIVFNNVSTANGGIKIKTNLPITIQPPVSGSTNYNQYVSKLNELKNQLSGNTKYLNIGNALEIIGQLKTIILESNGISNNLEVLNLIDFEFSLGNYNNPIIINNKQWFTLVNFKNALSQSNVNYDTNQINIKLISKTQDNNDPNIPDITINYQIGSVFDFEHNPLLVDNNSQILKYISSYEQFATNIVASGSASAFSLDWGNPNQWEIVETKTNPNDFKTYVYHIKGANGLKIQFTIDSSLTYLEIGKVYPNSGTINNYPSINNPNEFWVSYIPQQLNNIEPYLAIQLVADSENNYVYAPTLNNQTPQIHLVEFQLKKELQIKFDSFNDLTNGIQISGYSDGTNLVFNNEQNIINNILTMNGIQNNNEIQLQFEYALFKKSASNDSDLQIGSWSNSEGIKTLLSSLSQNEWVKFAINYQNYYFIKARIKIGNPTINNQYIIISDDQNKTFEERKQEALSGITLLNNNIKTKVDLSHYVNILKTKFTNVSGISNQALGTITLPSDNQDDLIPFLRNLSFDDINRLLNSIGIKVLFKAPGFNNDQFVDISQITSVNTSNQLFVGFFIENNSTQNNWEQSYELVLSSNSNENNDYKQNGVPLKLKLPLQLTINSNVFNGLKNVGIISGNTYQISFDPSIDTLLTQIATNIKNSNNWNEQQSSQIDITFKFAISKSLEDARRLNESNWYSYNDLKAFLANQNINYDYNGIYIKVIAQDISTNDPENQIQFSFTNGNIFEILNNHNSQVKCYVHLNETFKRDNVLRIDLTNPQNQEVILSGTPSQLVFKINSEFLNALNNSKGVTIQYCNVKPQENGQILESNWHTLLFDSNGAATISISPNAQDKFLAIRYVVAEQWYTLWPNMYNLENDPFNPSNPIIFGPEWLNQIKANIDINSLWLHKVVLNGNTKNLTNIDYNPIYQQIKNANAAVFGGMTDIEYLNIIKQLVTFEFSIGQTNPQNETIWYNETDFKTMLIQNQGHGLNDTFILLRDNFKIRYKLSQQAFEQYNFVYDVGYDNVNGITIIDITNGYNQDNFIGYIDYQYLVQKGFSTINNNFTVTGTSESPQLQIKNVLESLNKLFEPYISKSIFNVYASKDQLVNNSGQNTQIIWGQTPNGFVSLSEFISINFALDPLHLSFFVSFVVSQNNKYQLFNNDVLMENNSAILDLTNFIQIKSLIQNPLERLNGKLSPSFVELILQNGVVNGTKGKYLQGRGSFTNYVILNNDTQRPLTWERFIQEAFNSQNPIEQEMANAIEVVYHVKTEEPNTPYTFDQLETLKTLINDYNNPIWTNVIPNDLFVNEYIYLAIRVKQTSNEQFFIKNNSLTEIKTYGFMIDPSSIVINNTEGLSFINRQNIANEPVDGLTYLDKVSLSSNDQDLRIGKLMIQGIDLSLLTYNKYHKNPNQTYIQLPDGAYLPYRDQNNDNLGNVVQDGVWPGTNIPKYVYSSGIYKGLPTKPIQQQTPFDFNGYKLVKNGDNLFKFDPNLNSINSPFYSLYLNQTIGFKMELVDSLTPLPYNSQLYYWNLPYNMDPINYDSRLIRTYTINDGIKFNLYNPNEISLTFKTTPDQFTYKNPIDPSKNPTNNNAQIANPLSDLKISVSSPVNVSLNGQILSSPQQIQQFLDEQFGVGNLELTMVLTKNTDSREYTFKGEDINFQPRDLGSPLNHLENGDIITFKITSNHYLIPFENPILTLQVQGLFLESPEPYRFKYLRAEQIGTINGQGGFRILVNNPNDPNQVNDYSQLLGNYKFVARVWRQKRQNDGSVSQEVVYNWTTANETADWKLFNGDRVEWKLVSTSNENILSSYYNCVSLQNQSDVLSFARVQYNGNSITNFIKQYNENDPDGIGTLPLDYNENVYPQISYGGMVISNLLEKEEVLNISYDDFNKFMDLLISNIRYVGENGQGWLSIINRDKLYEFTCKALTTNNNQNPSTYAVNNNENNSQIITGKEILNNLLWINQTTHYPNNDGVGNILSSTKVDNQLTNGNKIAFTLKGKTNEFIYTFENAASVIGNSGQNPLIVYGLTQVNDPLAPLWYALIGIGSVVLIGLIGSGLLLAKRNKKLK